MGIDFDENKPIYQQLMRRISSEIVRGERKKGVKLDSVREYALETGVNVNTIQRVYRGLEAQGVVETRRGQGSFVTMDEDLLARLRENNRIEVTEQFVREMREMGFSVMEMIKSIKIEEQEK